ncbi:hypothetical protein AB0A98_22460 [Streptomyces chrestomyceticus]|uniref:hypothetical protein n=1 Tax=Streptomyces chrestomyceticus TaxID=68185 RepID=UPI00340F10BB
MTKRIPASAHAAGADGAKGSRGRKLAGAVLAGLLTASSFSLAPPAAAAERCNRGQVITDALVGSKPGQDQATARFGVYLCWSVGYDTPGPGSRRVMQPMIRVWGCEVKNPRQQNKWRFSHYCSVSGSGTMQLINPQKGEKERVTFAEGSSGGGVITDVKYPVEARGPTLPCTHGWVYRFDVDVTLDGSKAGGEATGKIKSDLAVDCDLADE